MTTLFCFAGLVTICFFVAVFKFKKYNPEDAAAMIRVFSERYKTMHTLTTPEQFDILKQHINSDADKYRLLVHPDVVNTKVAWLKDEIEKRTDELFKPRVEIDWLFNHAVYNSFS